MEAAFLIPNSNLVRDPKTKDPLPIVGEIKTMIGPDGRYWRRRLRDGAVRIGSPSSGILKAKVLSKKKEK